MPSPCACAAVNRDICNLEVEPGSWRAGDRPHRVVAWASRQHRLPKARRLECIIAALAPACRHPLWRATRILFCAPIGARAPTRQSPIECQAAYAGQSAPLRHPAPASAAGGAMAHTGAVEGVERARPPPVGPSQAAPDPLRVRRGTRAWSEGYHRGAGRRARVVVSSARRRRAPDLEGGAAPSCA